MTQGTCKVCGTVQDIHPNPFDGSNKDAGKVVKHQTAGKLCAGAKQYPSSRLVRAEV